MEEWRDLQRRAADMASRGQQDIELIIIIIIIIVVVVVMMILVILVIVMIIAGQYVSLIDILYVQPIYIYIYICMYVHI